MESIQGRVQKQMIIGYNGKCREDKHIYELVLIHCSIYRWEEGLLDMCVGDKRKLTIPPELAYGDRAMGPLIPAYSTLGEHTYLAPWIWAW